MGSAQTVHKDILSHQMANFAYYKTANKWIQQANPVSHVHLPSNGMVKLVVTKQIFVQITIMDIAQPAPH
jgi:hypothetical protein